MLKVQGRSSAVVFIGETPSEACATTYPGHVKTITVALQQKINKNNIKRFKIQE